MKIDDHIKNMMLENTIAKEMFIACALKMIGVDSITPDALKQYTLVQRGTTECGVSKIIYSVEHTPKKKRRTGVRK